MKMRDHRLKSIIGSALLLALVSMPVCVHAGTEGFAGIEFIKKNYTFCKVEMRMWIPHISGSIPNFFLIDERADQGIWEEIDFEFLAMHRHAMWPAIHSFNKGHRSAEELTPLGFNIDDGYHTYALEWGPDYIKWWADGKVIRHHKEENGQVREDVLDPWSGQVNKTTYTTNYLKQMRDVAQMKFVSTWWVCPAHLAGWCGGWDPNQGCYKSIFVSWIKFHKYDKGNGPDGSDFVLEYYDDFNGDDMDPDLWNIPVDAQNIVVRDGKCIYNMGCDVYNNVGEGGFKGDYIPVDDKDDGSWLPATSTAKPLITEINTAAPDYSMELRGRKIFFTSENKNINTIQVSNLQGAVLFEKSLKSGAHEITLPKQLSPGTYIFRAGDTHTPEAQRSTQRIQILK